MRCPPADDPGPNVCACHWLHYVSGTVEHVPGETAVLTRLLRAVALARRLEARRGSRDTSTVCADCERLAPGLDWLLLAPNDPRLTLSSVARSAGVSRWYASRMIVACTGSGFRVHLHQLRVLSALLALLHPHTSVKEASARAGYRAAAELHRQMVRHLGLLPSQVCSLREQVAAVERTQASTRPILDCLLKSTSGSPAGNQPAAGSQNRMRQSPSRDATSRGAGV